MKYLPFLLVLLFVPSILAYNVTIKPASHDFVYKGEDKTLSFEVCHDANTSLSIPIITEVSADSLKELAKVRIDVPYKVTTSKCKSVNLKLSSASGFNPSRVIIKMHHFDEDNIIKLNDSSIISNLALVANQTGLEITPQTNSTFAKKEPNRVLQVAVIVIVIIIFAIVIYYYYNQNQASE